MRTLDVTAWAKVNLALKITGKRADGYHLLQSVFQKITLGDRLVFTRTGEPGVHLTCDDHTLPHDGRNLVIKAAWALQERAGGAAGARVKLEKRVPVGAGLGGGSADAAAALLALNELWELRLPRDELASIAVKLGADVPFFLNGPMAWVEGIGENVTPLAPLASFALLLLNPGFPVLAADAYQGSRFDFTTMNQREEVCAAFASGDPSRAAKWLVNDLQPWAAETYPAVAALLETARAHDPAPLGVMMSGSGPTAFALYRDKGERDAAARALSGAAPFVAAVDTMV